jgi:hypothetical protein
MFDPTPQPDFGTDSDFSTDYKLSPKQKLQVYAYGVGGAVLGLIIVAIISRLV